MSEAMTYKLPPLPEHIFIPSGLGFTKDDMQAYAIAAIEAQSSVVQQDQSDREYAYGVIDRFLRNSLHDEGYEEFSEALDTLYTHPAPQAKPQPLSDKEADRMTERFYLSGRPVPALYRLSLVRATERHYGIKE